MSHNTFSCFQARYEQDEAPKLSSHEAALEEPEKMSLISRSVDFENQGIWESFNRSNNGSKVEEDSRLEYKNKVSNIENYYNYIQGENKPNTSKVFYYQAQVYFSGLKLYSGMFCKFFLDFSFLLHYKVNHDI